MSPFNNNSHPTSSLQTLAVMVLVGLASLTACSEASDDGLSSSGTWVDADTAIPDTAFHETDASTGTPDTAPSDTSTPDTAIPDTSLQDSSSDSATIAEDSASTTEDSASTAEDADTGFEDTRIPQPDDVSPDESDTQEESCGADGDLPTATAEVTGRYHMYRDLGFGRAVDPGRVVVYLPESYDSDGPERYPVLYMHDGQNLFHDREAAFGVSWGVDDTLDALTRAGTIRPWIVVALDNTPARLDAYTPDADPDYGGGQSAVYMDLLVERIKPFIESRYRVLCGASHTALAGSSLGGLVSLDAMVRYPGLFGRVGALSPSLWWNGRSLLTRLAAFTGPLPQRVWLDAGTEEGSPTPTGAHTVSVNARTAVAHLMERGASYGQSLAYLEDQGAAHNEAAWAGRLEAVFTWLLTDRSYTPSTPALSAELRIYRPRLSVGDRSDAILHRTYTDGARLSWWGAWSGLTSSQEEVARIDGDHVQAVAHGSSVLYAPGSSSPRALVQVGGSPNATRVRLEVDAPNTNTDPIHVSGNLMVLGDWDGFGLPLNPRTDGDGWAIEFDVPTGMGLEYKYTQGSWALVEKGPMGEELGNRTVLVEQPLLLHDVVDRWATP